MIRVGNAAEADKNRYDANWLIVRKPDEMPDFVKHEPLLSPSPGLFRLYREAFHAGRFDRSFFENVYVPRFLSELIGNKEALALLDQLARRSGEEDILLACYCEDETMCHRSIIAGILLGMGADIETRAEYIRYHEDLRKMGLHLYM